MDRPLYTDDVVASKTDATKLAVVERTHADVDSHEPDVGRTDPGVQRDKAVPVKSFKQFMRDGIPPKGTVFVRWTHFMATNLAPESHFVLIDRSILIGDAVRRKASDPMSGIILNTYVTAARQE